MLDFLAAALVIAGGTMYAVAYVGLERLRAAPYVAFTKGMSIRQLADHHRLSVLSWWGLGAIAAGLTVAGAAWIIERRRNR